jgi:3-phenylpropionate/trans-cinnamate dioxygenase ferredoxin subunit
MAFVKVATLQEIPEGTGKQVSVNGRNVALFNLGGTVVAIDDTCPHRGGPLSEGVVSGTEVMCPWHGARFDLNTGNHLSPPARNGVTVFKVQLNGDEIQIDVSGE